MKKLMFICLLAIVFPVILSAQTENTVFYSEKWKAINQDISDQLPESALKKLIELKLTAEKERNLQENFKINIHIFRLKLEKNPDSYDIILNELVQYSEKFPSSPEKLLLYAVCAEMYNRVYHQNQWQIDQRTHIQGEIPEDIKTWSAGNFKKVIMDFTEKSMENQALSQATPVQEMNDLLLTDSTNRSITSTLFDILILKKISITNEFELNELTEESWKQLINFRKTQPDKTSLIQAELGLINFRFENKEDSEKKLFRTELDSLEYIYKNDPAVIEIFNAKASSWLYDNSVSGHKRIAYRICEDGIRKYPDYFRINILKNLINTISEKSVRTTQNDKINPGKYLKVQFFTKNIGTVKVSFYRVNASAEAYYKFRSNWHNREVAYPDRTLVEKQVLNIPYNPEFEEVKSYLKFQSDKFGIYEFGCITDEKNDSTEKLSGHFSITDFALISKNGENKSIYILDRQTGKPVSNVNIKTYDLKWNQSRYELQLKSESKTNKNGFSNSGLNKEYSNNIIFLENGEDKYFATSSYSYFYNNPEFEEKTKISIFTDRSIYRPGQTVYFKAIAYQSTKNTEKVISGEKIELIMTDANGEQAGKINLITNDFGSVSGSFILPSGKLNGNFSIIANKISSTNIKVEEYKRPTFEVTVNQPVDEVFFGEKISLKGKVNAFAGYHISGSVINYKIEKSSHPYCRNFYKGEIIANGATKTDANGNFEITFVPEKEENINFRFPEYSLFEITADVTAPSGETQQGSCSVSVGERSLIIETSIPELIKKGDKTTYPVTVKTLQGEIKNRIIDYELIRLKDTTEFMENLPEEYEFEIKEMLEKGKFDTGKKQFSLNLNNYTPGRYRIKFITSDNKNKEVTISQDFIFYDSDSHTPVIKTYAWQSNPDITYLPGQKVMIHFGTSVKNAWVLYETMQSDKTLSAKWLKMNDEVKFFEIKTDKKFKDGTVFRFTLVKDEKMFSKSIILKEKKTEKIIQPKLNVFRDNLKPGETVSWTAVIDSTRLNKETEMLIGMYDSSLDKFQSHHWYFSPAYQKNYRYSPNWQSAIYEQIQGWKNFPVESYKYEDFSQGQINFFGLDMEIGGGFRMNPVRYRLQGVSVANEENEMAFLVVENSKSTLNEVVTSGVSKKSLTASVVKTNTVTNNSSQKPIGNQLRTNFNETAFFYPQLHCDLTGNFNFSFTVPESLTRWNLQMLAHSKNLFSGISQQTIITQKDLMIQLNLPVFVRETDEMSLTATVISLSDSILDVKVNLSLLNPELNEVKYHDFTENIRLKPGESKIITTRVKISGEQNLLIARATAETDRFSDGEQKYLPVLSSKILIQESLPLNIKGGQSKEFHFKNLEENYKTVESKLLTLEFTSNPLWYAIEALQVLSEPVNNNAPDYFTAWYANEMASLISSQNPSIKQIINQLEQTGQSGNNLISALEKNPELKMMLQEETPWVMEAKEETERMKRLKLIFDINYQNQMKSNMLEKLEKLQMPSGGFSWYEGMPESRWITQYILRGLSRININDTRVQSMKEKAVIYLDNQLNKDFEDLKIHIKNYKEIKTIGCIQLQYLSYRLKDIQIGIPDFAREAFDYYTQQTVKYKNTFSLYEKALAVKILYHNDNKAVAEALIRSFRENALIDEETGMYWAKNKSGYGWNERPVSVHTAIMEAFSLISNDKQEMDAMKTWLLKQKQTRQWESPVVTAEAVQALLTFGNDWVNKRNEVKISIGRYDISTNKSSPGSGYIKTQLSADDVSKGIKIKVDSENQSPSWGAVHWQYLQQMDKIAATGSGLSVRKQLMIEKIIDKKPTLMAINNAKDKIELQKGDKIVSRIIVSTDRNLEFVALKDLKAACMEPVNQISGCSWKQGLIYYRNPKDASVNYFFQFLPKGTYVFEDEYFIVNTGIYTGGSTSIQCLYAPEFIANGAGEKINIKD